MNDNATKIDYLTPIVGVILIGGFICFGVYIKYHDKNNINYLKKYGVETVGFIESYWSQGRGNATVCRVIYYDKKGIKHIKDRDYPLKGKPDFYKKYKVVYDPSNPDNFYIDECKEKNIVFPNN
jgi:hypothetical protein